MNNIKKYVAFSVLAAGLTVLAVATPAFALSHHAVGTKPAVEGKVTKVIGTTITLMSHKSNQNSPTTYTINASHAVVMKGNVRVSVSKISVGDNIVVWGTVSGTHVVATNIVDGEINK